MKDKLLYSVLGGCVGAILTSIFSLFSPLNAQDTPPDAQFGKITCTELEVVDSKGKALVGLYSSHDDTGQVGIYGAQGGSVFLSAETTGRIVLSGPLLPKNPRNEGRIELGFGVEGPYLHMRGSGVVFDKDGDRTYQDGEVWMGITGHGGHVNVPGESGEAIMRVYKHGGYVSVSGNKRTNNLHQALDLFGKGPYLMKESDHTRAALAILETGCGVVVTWDENGNPYND